MRIKEKIKQKYEAKRGLLYLF